MKPFRSAFFFMLLLATGLLAAGLPSACIPPEQPGGQPVAMVDRIVDGDTIEVTIGGQKYTVRYIGIDTPETVHPTRGEEPYGREAKEKNRELVEGRKARLEKDVSETDRYSRLLRYVYVGDLFVNAELVRLGYAQAISYPPDVKYQDLFRRLEKEAREAGMGLWGLPPATPEPLPSGITVPPGYRYVGSRNSDKYHYPSCRYAVAINAAERVWFVSAKDAQSGGYVPCGVCRPPRTD